MPMTNTMPNTATISRRCLNTVANRSSRWVGCTVCGNGGGGAVVVAVCGVTAASGWGGVDSCTGFRYWQQAAPRQGSVSTAMAVTPRLDAVETLAAAAFRKNPANQGALEPRRRN